MALTREQILNKVDIQVTEIPVPEWGGTVHIRQLTRAEQDEYLKRQLGDTRLKQDQRARSQEMVSLNLYGHDAYLCVCGLCDAEGKPLFTVKDIDALKKKNGEVVGRLALEIVKFSGMLGDQTVEDEIKN